MKKLIICLVAVLIFSLLPGCQGRNSGPELLEPVTVKNDTAVAQYGDIYNVTVYSAEVAPYVEDLYFSVDGVLDTMNVIVGDSVYKGQTLATLNSDAIVEEIAQLEADIENIEIMGEYNDRLMTADIEIARYELELLGYYASTRRIEAKKLEIQQLESDLAEAVELRQLDLDRKNKKLEELNTKLENTTLVAPFSGRIVYVSTSKTGDRIGSYTTVICMVDESRLFIVSDFISEYKVNGASSVTAHVLDKEYQVKYLPMSTDNYYAMILSGGVRKTEFAVVGSTAGLESGQFASVTVIDSYKDNVLVIPANAVYRDEKGHYVYKMIDGARVRQDVKIGMQTPIEIEITEGLQEGEVVYVKG